GQLTEARSRIGAALDLIESLRSKVTSQDLRASYLASNYNSYDLYIDVLMRLYQSRPADGFDAEALLASERAHARSLLETLVEARAAIRQGMDPALIERERELQRQLNAKERYRWQLLSGKYTAEQAAAADKELETLLARYKDLQAQMQASSPRYAAL